MVTDADEVAVILADATTNHLTDAAEYVYPDAETDEPNAALFSTADLTIGGTGSLTVVGSSNDGIASKDGLVIAGGEITVTAVDDGIRGKDYLVVDGGEISVTSGGDALKSDNEEDAGTGFVAVTGGTLAIDAGDDGVHAESDLSISAGTVDISRSNEGLESADMTISGGNISITASDDGINLAGGDGSGQTDAAATGTLDGAADSAMPPGPGDGGGPGGGGQPPAGGGQGPGGGGPGGGGMGGGEAVGDYQLSISGGEVVIDSGGDGLDSNGTAQMSGGTVVVNGPTNDGNAAIDVNGSFDITGGVLVAAGSAGMAEAPDATSAQAWLATTFQTAQPAGSVIAIEADGKVLTTFTASKAFSSLVLSSPDLVPGATYDVFTGATASGAGVGGLQLRRLDERGREGGQRDRLRRMSPRTLSRPAGGPTQRREPDEGDVLNKAAAPGSGRDVEPGDGQLRQAGIARAGRLPGTAAAGEGDERRERHGQSDSGVRHRLGRAAPAVLGPDDRVAELHPGSGHRHPQGRADRCLDPLGPDEAQRPAHPAGGHVRGGGAQVPRIADSDADVLLVDPDVEHPHRDHLVDGHHRAQRTQDEPGIAGPQLAQGHLAVGDRRVELGEDVRARPGPPRVHGHLRDPPERV